MAVLTVPAKNSAHAPLPSASDVIGREIFPVLPASLRTLLAAAPVEVLDRTEEIRLRQGRPLLLTVAGGDILLTADGRIMGNNGTPYLTTASDVAKAAQLISGSSIYALEDEIRNGFITLRGGHRVGLTGKAVLEGGRVKTIKNISGFNIRVAREIKGAADNIVSYLCNPQTRAFLHTLIISPPGCGKTTLLRDIVRQISDGRPEHGIPGQTVGLVDERSEVAGCYQGIPQKDVGIRTDVLDACPKAEGMMMLLRAMAPKVIAADEIGRREDVAALEEALNAGVKVLTTAHGKDREELRQRPVLKYLLAGNIFERLIILSRRAGVGTVEAVLDGATGKNLFQTR